MSRSSRICRRKAERKNQMNGSGKCNNGCYSRNSVCKVCDGKPGIVLLVTLVVLVVLAMLGYTLSSRVAAQRHRDNFIIDYQKAQYACDSAVKYALATLEDINVPPVVARPNEPDFSDLFALSEEEYQQLLQQWGYEENNNRPAMSTETPAETRGEINNVNDINRYGSAADLNEANDINAIKIRGPYGPVWPYIRPVDELEIGSATVRIEIEDENAKYPIGWALLDDSEISREARAGFETFCEWMGLTLEDIDSLEAQLAQLGEIKPFKVEFKPITKRTPVKTKTSGANRRTRSKRTRRTRYKTETTTADQQRLSQTKDFAKLLHSSLLDTELLARPTIISESRKESALKYAAMWGSAKVNINTAPRQVLEAAFTFGGDAEEIAEEIIQTRRIKPFESIEDLKKELLRYSTSIDKCEKFITTTSDFFTIKVTAQSGVAEASAVIAITKQGNKIQRVAVLSG